VLLFNGLQNYLAVFILAIFCASASFAAANDLNLQSDTITQTMHPTNESPIETSAGIKIDGFTGDYNNYRSEIIAFERTDKSIGSIKEYIEETCSIALRKHADKIIWSLAPSLDRFSFNPIDDIKNLQIVLKYRF
jgi:hypothetical protein